MRFGPPVSFTRTANGTTLAYQVLGEGPLDLVFLFGWPSHLALMWENPAFADFLHRLASFSRLILFDRTGNGMSDRGPTGHAFEDWMDDVRAVMTAVGSERTAFFGCHLGGRLALLFAATHPELTSAVVTFAAHPATLRDDDYPWGATPEERAELIDAIGAGALDPEQLLHDLAPTRRDRRRHPPVVDDLLALGRQHARVAGRDPGDGPGGHPRGARRRPGARAGAAPGRRPHGATSGRAGTWPIGCRRRRSGSCRATTTSRSSATRTPSWR